MRLLYPKSTLLTKLSDIDYVQTFPKPETGPIGHPAQPPFF